MDVTCQLAIWWDILKEDMDIKRSPNRMQSGMKQLGTVLQLLVYLFFLYLSINLYFTWYSKNRKPNSKFLGLHL